MNDVESNEQILRRLDRWYSDKVKERYTEELGREVIGGIFGRLLTIEREDIAVDLIKSRTYRKFLREEQVRNSENYFSGAYHSARSVLDDYIRGLAGQRGLEEYTGPLLGNIARMDGFVDKVRKAKLEGVSSELSDKEIDNLFLNVFGGHHGFSEFCISYMRAFGILLDLSVSKKAIPPEIAKDGLTLSDVVKEELKKINERIFGDLKRN